MILSTDRKFPPDIRVEKEVHALLEGGAHRVTVLVPRIGEEPEREELRPGYRVIRATLPRPSPLDKLAFSLQLRCPWWSEALGEFLKYERPDALHVHDQDLLCTTLEIAEPAGVPVIADLHENMPAALRALRCTLPRLVRWKRGLTRNYHVYRHYERSALLRCARVLVVTPEAAERIYRYGVDPQRVVLVSNTESLETFPIPPRLSQEPIHPDRFVVSYVGGIGPHRGIDTAISALPHVRAQIPHVKLCVVGAKPEQKSALEAQADALGVLDLLDVRTWVPAHEVQRYIRASAVCLVPHKDLEHTNTTVPHKLFQYMLCRVPVLVSSCAPLARIAKETGGAFVFRASDPQSLARVLIEMHGHPERVAQCVERAYRAACGPYSFEHDAARLREAYAQLAYPQLAGGARLPAMELV